MASPKSLHIAIIGGGLCGLALATALKTRHVPFTLYESRKSFTELGAGINLGPNTLEAFRLISPTLSTAVEDLCTRNPEGKEDVWMTLRLGAKAGELGDAALLGELLAPPTGNATVRRNDLLALLAEGAGMERARFEKKVVDVSQSEEGVTLTFADGTRETASAVVACDGVHSAVRRGMVGEDHPAARPVYSGSGAYRAVLPMGVLEEAVGTEIARMSTLWIGPGGYVIMYPVERGEKVNIGFWPRKPGPWLHKEWVLSSQWEGLEKDFRDWGEMVHKIMALMEDPPFSAAFYHAEQPDSMVDGRVCLIGDAAHAMPPHQGAGAGQAMEDAYVISEVLGSLDAQDTTARQIESALKAFGAVRTPRSQRVLESSVQAMDYWSDFYREGLTAGDIERFGRESEARFRWIWDADLAGQARQAIVMLQGLSES